MKRRDFVTAGVAIASAWPFRGWSTVLKDVGDVAARSLDGAELNLPGAAVADFAAGLRGDLLLQGNQRFAFVVRRPPLAFDDDRVARNGGRIGQTAIAAKRGGRMSQC